MADSRDDRRDALYDEAVRTCGDALQRLARGYAADPDRRRDLLQDIHVALWRSLASFDGQCSLRTWIYRVAHNTAISLVVRRRDVERRLIALDDLELGADDIDADRALDEQRARERLQALIQSLTPIDREVMLLYLEGLDAATIAEITGVSAGNVATKVHRIKRVLIERFYEGTR
jgi:RNA polymerase sigma-70 factor (ECF subfamily)